MRTDRWDNTRGRSEGPERCRTRFRGKEGNDISISIRSDLRVGGGAVFHLGGEFTLRNGPGRREERRGQLRKMEMEIWIKPTL